MCRFGAFRAGQVLSLSRPWESRPALVGSGSCGSPSTTASEKESPGAEAERPRLRPDRDQVWAVPPGASAISAPPSLSGRRPVLSLQPALGRGAPGKLERPPARSPGALGLEVTGFAAGPWRLLSKPRGVVVRRVTLGNARGCGQGLSVCHRLPTIPARVVTSPAEWLTQAPVPLGPYAGLSGGALKDLEGTSR